MQKSENMKLAQNDLCQGMTKPGYVKSSSNQIDGHTNNILYQTIK